MIDNTVKTDGFGHAFKALFFIGSVQVLMAVLFLFSNQEKAVLASLLTAVAGGVLIGLGIWAKYSGKKVPFWIGIALCLGYIVIMVVTGALGGIIATAILLFFLVRGTRFEPLKPAGNNYQDEDAPLDSDM
jgi:peptidoglycan/LPS O-acetylase OafA/YrhL